MARTTVVILTDAEDTTASRVAAELALRGVPVVRFDTAEFPQRLRLTATHGRNGWNGVISGDDVAVALTEVASVYYRRPTRFDVAEEMSGPERYWASAEARRGFGGVVQALPCLWVNDPVSAAACEYKPVQLATADRCGLTTPRSLISNDPDQAFSWAKALDAPFIYKPLGGAMHHEAGGMTLVYTQRLDDPSVLHDSTLTLTAHLFQEWVPKAYEARCVVVGDRVFTVAIHGGSPESRVDWRADYDALRYEVTEPPPLVREQLLSLHRALGLHYGACDMVVTPDGEWVFLEVNQAGEWGWLAHETGLPIAQAVAELLAGAVT
jgi:ATP-grasp ribosomal peptide maturase